MNITEKKYLLKRIDELSGQKQQEIREEQQKKPNNVFNIRYALVKAGKVKLRKNLNKCDSAFSEFDFDKYPEATAIPYWAVPPELNTEVTRVKDAVMLGTDEEAHKMLKAFENWKMK
jgi:hypothetical protein